MVSVSHHLILGPSNIIKGTDTEFDNMAMRITSSAFEDQEGIPARYTCDGEDLSPALDWSDVPEGTKSLTLIMDDPDAPMGTWVHWVMYDIPISINGLEESVSSDPELKFGGKHGTNSWKRFGYGGPCPPGKKPHRYMFKLYALDCFLDLDPGIKVKRLMKIMEGHIIEKTELVGLYVRSQP